MRRLSRLPVGGLLAGGAVVLAFAAFLLWMLPSPDYLYLPNKAQPIDPRIKVEGGHVAAGPGRIYYLDVTLRRATWLEHLLAFTRPDGASLVPASQVVPSGSSFDEEHRQELAAMDRSEQVAAAVALRKAGFAVKTTLTGVLVELIAPDAPAARVLRPGDLIVSVNGTAVQEPTQLRALISRHHPGDVISLGVRRGDTSTTLAVRTVPDPSNPGAPIIGIRIAQGATIKLPRNVQIDLGGVVGPSAGLPFALDVFEQLGGNADHGLRVAATGELDLDGSVRPIGGVKQKTFGARQAGVDVLLMPAGENAAEARRYAGGLRVIPVESFQQALHALATLAPGPATHSAAAPSK